MLLNDPTYVEASRAFAERIVKFDGERRRNCNWRFAAHVQRDPSGDEVAVLSALHQKHLDHYKATSKDAEAFLRIGERALPTNVRAAELAAWTNVTRVILNLHETITRN